MNKKDPIQKIEEALKHVHHKADKHAKPVLSRYPVLFSLLVVFGILSIQYSFENLLDGIPLLRDHPGYLMTFGILILLITGTLFKTLKRVK